MGELSPWHWIIVLLLAAVLFGSKKLPDAARGIGKSLRIFKAEMAAARDDEPGATAAATSAPFATVPPVPAQPVNVQPVNVQPTATPPATGVQDAVPTDRVPEQQAAAAPQITVDQFTKAAEPVKPTVDH